MSENHHLVLGSAFIARFCQSRVQREPNDWVGLQYFVDRSGKCEPRLTTARIFRYSFFFFQLDSIVLPWANLLGPGTIKPPCNPRPGSSSTGPQHFLSIGTITASLSVHHPELFPSQLRSEPLATLDPSSTIPSNPISIGFTFLAPSNTFTRLQSTECPAKKRNTTSIHIPSTSWRGRIPPFPTVRFLMAFSMLVLAR